MSTLSKLQGEQYRAWRVQVRVCEQYCVVVVMCVVGGAGISFVRATYVCAFYNSSRELAGTKRENFCDQQTDRNFLFVLSYKKKKNTHPHCTAEGAPAKHVIGTPSTKALLQKLNHCDTDAYHVLPSRREKILLRYLPR